MGDHEDGPLPSHGKSFREGRLNVHELLAKNPNYFGTLKDVDHPQCHRVDPLMWSAARRALGVAAETLDRKEVRWPALGMP